MFCLREVRVFSNRNKTRPQLFSVSFLFWIIWSRRIGARQRGQTIFDKMASAVVQFSNSRYIFRLGRSVGLFAAVKPRNTKLNYTTRSIWNNSRITPSFQARLYSSTTSEKTSEIAAQTNWQRRVELATLYRGLEFYNLHEGVDNHVTMMAPAANGEGEVMLVIRRGLHWKEVGSTWLGVINRTLAGG